MSLGSTKRDDFDRRSTLTAAAHIITAVIGVGVVALPRAFAMLGWIAGPACILLFGGLTQVCSVLLARCYIIGTLRHGSDGKVNNTYSEVVAACFGRNAVTAIGVVQHANLFLVTLAYAFTASLSLQTIANSICRQNSSASCLNEYNLWCIIFGSTQLAMSQLPTVDSLWLASIIGAVMSFGYSGCAIGMSAAEIDGNPHGTLGGASFDSSAKKVFQLVEIQATIRMDRPPGPVASMRRAITISVSIMTSLYLAVACTGYAAFGNAVNGSIMTAFTSPGWLVNLANAMVVAHLGPAYQICIQPTFHFLEVLMQSSQRNPRWNQGLLLRLWFRSLTVVLLTFLAILMPFFESIIGLSGALSFWPVTVAVPIACFIRAHQPPARTQAWLHALNTATLLVTLAACVGAVYAVTQGWSTYGFFKGGG
ncbi:hypothetical protein COHA_007907 [Chlorella ohadii]|uniref:Amino acid transporter transmembrane domain-containing protein n=1 Tax=Chlorella ohadii TaxID=2649997 RepID=A0AAD5GZH7_9CHLO|nr:hypothetical protein COHA_007907 [Chlorella ohadii]